MKKLKELLGYFFIMAINVFGFSAAIFVTFTALAALEGWGWYLQVTLPLIVGISLMGATYLSSIWLIDYFFDKDIFY